MTMGVLASMPAMHESTYEKIKYSSDLICSWLVESPWSYRQNILATFGGIGLIRVRVLP